MTTLIIARHGNTFTADQTPTRVGKFTDLPLVEKGEDQARALGRALAEAGYKIDHAYVSNLQRTQRTASLALEIMQQPVELNILGMLDEIDYGPDENQTEENVIKRIGKKAVEAWDKNAIPPEGWNVSPDQIIKDWKQLSDQLVTDYNGQTILVVTSNGTARFAPHITNSYDAFLANYSIKLSTGAFGVLHHDGRAWHVKAWNVKPQL